MILRKVVERMGIAVHSGKRTVAVRSQGSVSDVVFADGSAIEADMVAGLTVERATMTDDQMRSVDDRDIHVVGECAQHRGEVYGLVAPLWEQATVLARYSRSSGLMSTRLDLLDVRKEDLPGVWADLDMPSATRTTSPSHGEDLRGDRLLPLRSR